MAYGSNLQQVKQLVEDALNALHIEWLDPTKPITTAVYELGDSSVNFRTFVWLEPLKRGLVISQVLGTIYDTLNATGVEIPFPQQDVHIKN